MKGMVREGFMKKGMLLIFLTTIFFTSLSYAGSNLFYPAINFPTGSSPAAVAVGDVNGDGRNDVVLLTGFNSDFENDYRIFVFIQNSSGELNPPIKYLTHSNYSNIARSIAIGDMNHDGRADVVVGIAGSNIEVFLQNESGGLESGVLYPTINSYYINLADLNKDGLLDVVGIGYHTNSVDVSLQNVNGTLNPPVNYNLTNGDYFYKELYVGDLNNDGLTDIIVTGEYMSSYNIGVLYQQPGGSFSAPVYYDLGINDSPEGLAVGDVNNDSLNDIVVTYGDNPPYSKLGVFLQNETATFDPVVNIDSNAYPKNVAIADMNNDGRQDVIVAHGITSLGLFLQGAMGSLLPEELYPLPYSITGDPQELAVGDINGDGLPDVVLADYSNGLVVLYSSNGPAIPRIDVSPSSANFGSIFLGYSASKDITIYNRGTGPLLIDSVTITGPNKAEFILEGSCTNIVPGGSCTLTATSIPMSVGAKYATLTMTSNDFDMQTMNLNLFAFCGPELFYPFMRFPVGSYSDATAIYDINGDGKKDVVTTTSYSVEDDDFKLNIFLQDENGHLHIPQIYDAGNGKSVDVGDLNNDGKPDIVVTTNEGIGILYQNSNGGFDAMTTINCHPKGFAHLNIVRIGDLNNDGRNDIVYAVTAPNNDIPGVPHLFIFYQNSDGTFSEPVTYHFYLSDLRLGDINHDGLTDIVMAALTETETNTSGVKIFLQNTQGTFDEVIYSVPGVWPSRLDIGDLNNDGLQDIAIIYSLEYTGYWIGVYIQNESGTLNPLLSYPTEDYPEAIRISDMNQDGKMDLILLHALTEPYNLFLTRYVLCISFQLENGTFSPEEEYWLTYPLYASLWSEKIAIGDINGDGSNDVVVAGDGEGLVVSYNRGPGPRLSSQSFMNFGTLKQGDNSSQIIYLFNEGDSDLNINSISLAGVNANEFKVIENSCAGYTIPSQFGCSLKLNFLPTSNGLKNATLSISSNDPRNSNKIIQLKGERGPGQVQVPQAQFQPYIELPIGVQMFVDTVATGDLNGDGRNDVAVTSRDGAVYGMYLFLQNSSGELDPPINYPVGNGESIDIGDLNNDGRKDILISVPNGIGIFYQNASGGLEDLVTYPTHSNPFNVKIGDFNNDGLLDVVSMGWGLNSPDVDIFLQNKSGTLNSSSIYKIAHDGHDDLDVGDINNDGLTDIVTMSGQWWTQYTVGAMMQNANGIFDPIIYHDPIANYDGFLYHQTVKGLAIGDINGDGLQDIVVTFDGNNPYVKIGIFYQNPSGGLDPMVSLDTYDYPLAVVVSDINNDGKQDIIVSHTMGGIGIYLQDSSGALLPEFRLSLPFSQNYYSQSLAVSDINGDGLKDIIVCFQDYSLAALAVFYNTPNLETISAPSIYYGPLSGITNKSYGYSAGSASSNMNHSIQYYFDWGDGTNSGWLPVGDDGSSKTWTIPGAYQVRARARCSNHTSLISSWSQTLTVTIINFNVVSPNGGETLTAGSTQTLRWVYTGNSGSYGKIELLKGEALNHTIAGFVALKNGAYNWKIPTDLIII